MSDRGSGQASSSASHCYLAPYHHHWLPVLWAFSSHGCAGTGLALLSRGHKLDTLVPSCQFMAEFIFSVKMHITPATRACDLDSDPQAWLVLQPQGSGCGGQGVCRQNGKSSSLNTNLPSAAREAQSRPLYTPCSRRPRQAEVQAGGTPGGWELEYSCLPACMHA